MGEEHGVQESDDAAGNGSDGVNDLVAACDGGHFAGGQFVELAALAGSVDGVHGMVPFCWSTLFLGQKEAGSRPETDSRPALSRLGFFRRRWRLKNPAKERADAGADRAADGSAQAATDEKADAAADGSAEGDDIAALRETAFDGAQLGGRNRTEGLGIGFFHSNAPMKRK
jgi:hypothetical protein